MAEYIDREAFIEWLKRIPIKDLSDGLGLCRVIMEDDFKKAIKKMPESIIDDLEEVRHGRWIVVRDNNNYPVGLKCSGCGRKVRKRGENYCPECGAKMDNRVV